MQTKLLMSAVLLLALFAMAAGGFTGKPKMDDPEIIKIKCDKIETIDGEDTCVCSMSPIRYPRPMMNKDQRVEADEIAWKPYFDGENHYCTLNLSYLRHP